MRQYIERTGGFRTFALLSAVGLAAGCSGGPSAQLMTCQQDKEQLLATIREQRDTNLALRQEKESLASRLDQAEKELARASSPTRLSSRPLAASQLSASPPVQVESLPWRAPSGKVESADTAPRDGSVER
jgi:hypothetical protein